MILMPFETVFPEIAKSETRVMQLVEKPEDAEGPPLGFYTLLELYCPDPDCDCRKVNIVFISNEDGKEHATIHFGWEDKKYYDNFFGFDDHGLPGPNFAPMQFFKESAFQFLDMFKQSCCTDEEYVESLEKHYWMIKEEARKRDLFEEIRKVPMFEKSIRKSEKVNRNTPCPCGSGKKYKRCCISAKA